MEIIKTIKLNSYEKEVIKELENTLDNVCNTDFPDCTGCPFEFDSHCLKGKFFIALNKFTNYQT